MESWLTPRQLGWLWGLMAASALAIVALSEWTGVDLMMADWMFDWQMHAFAYRHAFIFETVMHDGAKQLLVGLWGMLLLVGLLPQCLKPAGLSLPMQIRLRWVAALAVINSGLVSWLKHQMPHACPWHLSRYGGNLPWFSSFERHAPQMAGHCFPAGHATSGLWLTALCLCYLPQHPRKALWVFGSGLLFGGLLGLAQQLRGAHFLSHTLVSLWWMSALLLCVLTFTKAPS